MSDSMAFFEKYYGRPNMVTAIVGGIKAKEIIPIIDKYFGRMPARPKPESLRTHRAAAGRRDGDDAARSGAADLHRGLPQAGGH